MSSNQVSHFDGGTGDRKLVCDRPFALLLRNACICSSPRAPSPNCALLSAVWIKAIQDPPACGVGVIFKQNGFNILTAIYSTLYVNCDRSQAGAG